eukprot:6470034-Prymnesium_polylepis.1
MKDIESSDARDLPGPARAPLDGTALRGRSSDARSIRMIAQSAARANKAAALPSPVGWGVEWARRGWRC